MSSASAQAAPGGTAVTLVTQTRVAPAHDEEFARWQQRVNDAISQFPGYQDYTLIPPHPPVQVDWVIAQRFDSAVAARAWLQSEQRLDLLDDIQPLLVGQDDVHIFPDGAGPGLIAPVTAVISMRVQPEQETVFQEWQRRIAAVEARFEGFSGYRLEPPIPGIQDDWVTLIRFDSDAHLDAWLSSEPRQRLLEETARFSPEFHTRKVRTGFDSWFPARAGAAPPTWKQSLIVLLTLYPTVFLFGYFVQTPLLLGRGVPSWLAPFLGNVVSTALLGWLFVGWARRLLDWWLHPAPSAPCWVNWAGAGVIFTAFGASLLVFSRFP